MASSDVYLPSSGELRFSGPIPAGCAPAHPPNSDRPGTNSSRFGRMSHSSFFVRHAPHPKVVRHIKGLLDIPICAVNDVGSYKSTDKPLQFPPDNFNQRKMDYFGRYQDLPSHAINVNSQTYPINTITGLQYFLGKPMNMRVYREGFRPRLGLADPPEVWRDELRAIMRGVGLQGDECEQMHQPYVAQPPPLPRTPASARAPETSRPQTKTRYSESTGRLIPPPSRAMSRGFSRQGHKRDQFLGQMQTDLSLDSNIDNESLVMGILCQILQTDDVTAVQSWLVSAGDQEKMMLVDMLRAAMGTKDAYYKRESEEVYPQAPPPRQPVEGVIGDHSSAHRIDRLSLDGDRERTMPVCPEGQDVTTYRYTPKPHHLPPLHEHTAEDTAKPVTCDPFRPSSKAQPASRLVTPKLSDKEPEFKLKYTMSSKNKNEVQEQEQE